MKIAQLSPPFIAVPPKDYGGIELVVHNLTEGLVKKGHDVTLFAPGSSKTDSKLISPFPRELDSEEQEKLFSPLALKLFWMHSLPSIYHASLAFEHAAEFDVIHNHFHYLGLFFANLVKTPVVNTYHGDLSSAQNSPIEAMILEKFKDANWIAISESQKRNCKIKLNFVGVVHHGVQLEKFGYEEKPKDYLVWLGRITPKKGLMQAIEIAHKTQHKLYIAGVVHPRDQEFFKSVIEPQIDNKLIFSVGALSLHEKVRLLKNARALLYPVTWEEPFGLVMIEAMSCGTPVIGFAHGAVNEVIKDGETGLLINHTPAMVRGDWLIKNTGVQGMIEAVEYLSTLPEQKYRQFRRQARNCVEKNFTVETMVKKHEAIYRKIL